MRVFLEVKLCSFQVETVQSQRFKVNGRNTRKICEIWSKLTIKTPERRYWRHSGFFIVNLEHIIHLFLVFLFWLWTGQVNIFWVLYSNLYTICLFCIMCIFPIVEANCRVSLNFFTRQNSNTKFNIVQILRPNFNDRWCICDPVRWYFSKPSTFKQTRMLLHNSSCVE